MIFLNTIWTHVNNVHGNFHIDIFKIFSFHGRKCKGIKYQDTSLVILEGQENQRH